MRVFSKHIPLVFGLLILVAGCKETPLPPVVIEEPVFFVKGTVGGETVEINAGKDDYYLFTDFEQDTAGLYTFRSELSAPGKPAVMLSLNSQTRAGQGASVDPSEAFRETSYPFAVSDSVLVGYNVSFKADAPGATNIEWRLKNTDRGSGAEIMRYYNLAETDSFSVELLTVSPGNCRSVLQERVAIPKPDCHLDFEYKPSRESGKRLEFEVKSPLAPASLTWIFNGLPVRGGRTIVHDFSSRGIFRTCVEQDNCKAQRCKNVIAGNAGGCPANFSYETEEVYKALLLQPGEIVLEWRDENGRIFSTKARPQPSDSYFRLSMRESYEQNTLGDPTEKMQLDIRCRAYSGSDSLLIELNEVHWAFAYPE
ncbi:MAG: hypothetical protein R3B47_10845 [Bacteroidia bacterium]